MPLQHITDSLGSNLTSQLRLSRVVGHRTLVLTQIDNHKIVLTSEEYIDTDLIVSTITTFYAKDWEIALKTIKTLPWEQNIYGITPGFMHNGHEIVCLECAKNLFFEGSDIQMVDVTHTPRQECGQSCGNWVGVQCNNEECYEPVETEDCCICDSCLASE